MTNYIEKAKELLLQEPLELMDFLDNVYEYCEDRKDLNKDVIHQHTRELNEAMHGLSLAQENDIGCACMALCAEYEYSAFTDGFQKGAALILSLLEHTNGHVSN